MSGNDILMDVASINLGICLSLLLALQLLGVPWNWAGILLFSVLFWILSYIIMSIYIGHVYRVLNLEKKRKEEGKSGK